MTIIRVKRGTRPPVTGVTTTKVMTDAVTVADVVARVLRRTRMLSDAVVASDGSVTGAAAGAPQILYTDIVAGPTSGGENNLGCYLSVFGINFGAQAGMGTTTKLYVNGAEVANYRYLGQSAIPTGVFTPEIQQLTVQVGSLGGLAAGTAGAIQIVVGGVGSNTDLTFMPQPGSIIFVATTGSNSNAGTSISAPKKDLQLASGTGGSGSPTAGAFVDTTSTPPGTYVVLRGGTYTATGKDDYWCRIWRLGGRAPNGSADMGYLTITAYPGSIGGNAIEDVHYTGQAGKQGGICGNDEARARDETAPWGGQYGQYVAVSNLRIDLAATCTDAPVTMSSSGDHWRIVNNKLGPWLANDYGKAACVGGNGDGSVVYGNYCHDLESPTEENHGVYLDGSWKIASNCEIAYNYIVNMNGGSGIQCHNQSSNIGTFVGIRIHHNYIDTTLKYGINYNQYAQDIWSWNNIILNTGSAGIRTNTGETSLSLIFQNNLIYNSNTGGAFGNNSMFSNENTLTSGYVDVKNNIFVMGAVRSNNNQDYYGTSTTDTISSFRGNLYYDPKGIVNAKYSGDTTGTYGDPKFVTPYTNLRLQSTSPALNLGISTGLHLTVSSDFDNNPQPRAGKTNPSAGPFA